MRSSAVPFLVLLSLAVPAAARGELRITGVELPSGPYSAGGKLALEVTVASDAGLDLGSGSGVAAIPMENIPANAFPNGTGDGHALIPLGGDRYRVADLALSPFVYTGPQGGRFVLNEIYVIDRKGQAYELKILSLDAEYYVDKDYQPTDVPVVRFDLRPNSQPDLEGPRISEFRLEQATVRRGQELKFRISATDAISGVLTDWAAVSVTEAIFPSLQAGQAWGEKVGEDTILFTGPAVLSSAPVSTEDLAVVLLQILDRAGNYAQLTRRDPEDEFYWYSNPAGAWMTGIPVAKFRVVE
jgi:hypothetical protein